MSQKTNNEKKRKPRNDVDDVRSYHHMKNKELLHIRLRPEEWSLLESRMREEGWENTTGFVKEKLFGTNPERTIQQRIEAWDIPFIGTLLQNILLNWSDKYIYLSERYTKDMIQLYREDGFDQKQWAAVTNRWRSELAKSTEQTLRSVRNIEEALGLLKEVRLPSDAMQIDDEHPSQEKLDQLALQLRRERIARGILEEF